MPELTREQLIDLERAIAFYIEKFQSERNDNRLKELSKLRIILSDAINNDSKQLYLKF